MHLFSRIIKTALAVAAALLMVKAAPASANAPTPAKGGGTVAPAKGPAAEPRTVRISVTSKGYEPSPVTLKKGEPVKLVVTRTTDRTCANEIVLEEHGINVPLPLNEPVEVTFTPSRTGRLTYGCAMGKMISGVLKVE